MIKDTELKKLKEIVNQQKIKLGLTDINFSYSFDSRTEVLKLNYSIPMMKMVNGKRVIRKVRQNPKYLNDINRKNWRKWFKARTTRVQDDYNYIQKQIQNYEKEYENRLDETDFGFWRDEFVNRKVGNNLKLLSKETIKKNKSTINQYYDWLTKYDKNSLDIMEHVEMGSKWFTIYYQDKLVEGIWNQNSVASNFRNVRGFYNFIGDQTDGKFPWDILKRLKIKSGEKRRDAINQTEFDKILKFISDYKDDPLEGKFVLLLRLQLKTGMRVGELVTIKNNDIEIDEKRIWIEGKSGRRKLNFIGKDDENIWNDILNKIDPKATYLFYQTKVHYERYKKVYMEVDIDKHKHTTTNYYQKRFRLMRDKLGLRGKGIISSHSLRRYFITQFFKVNPNNQLIRQIVGHTTTRMTDEYVSDMVTQDTETTLPIGV
jgi:integrase